MLDVAAARFKAAGFGGVSFAEIAEDAGAVPSQVTYYFKTKEALFVEAACREMLYLARDAEIASQAATSTSAYLDIMVRSVLGAPGLSLFVEALALAHRRPALREQAQRTFERLDGESARAMVEYRARRGQTAEHAATHAHRFWTIAIGMGARGAATGEPLEFLVSEMLELLGDR